MDLYGLRYLLEKKLYIPLKEIDILNLMKSYQKIQLNRGGRELVKRLISVKIFYIYSIFMVFVSVG